MTKYFRIGTSLAAVASTVCLYSTAFADDLTSTLPQDTKDVLTVINRITGWLFTGLIIFSVVMLILAAYKYLFSQGAEENIGSAKKTIVYAVVALAVAMLAKGVPLIVQSLLKVH